MIIVLTYDHPHRKTQDLLMRLRATCSDEVFVVATPWEERKNFIPLIPHRPSEPGWPCAAMDISLAEMCRNLRYQLRVIDGNGLAGLFRLTQPEMVLVAGAGILTPDVIKSAIIVNSHPAMLPYARGLDALKWAIYNNLPVGVTLHIIDEHPDAGVLIKQTEVPLLPSDTFHSFAMRQYEMEMELLVNAPDTVRSVLDQGGPGEFCPQLSADGEAYAVHKRMPHIKEMLMMRRFESRRDNGGL